MEIYTVAFVYSWKIVAEQMLSQMQLHDNFVNGNENGNNIEIALMSFSLVSVPCDPQSPSVRWRIHLTKCIGRLTDHHWNWCFVLVPRRYCIHVFQLFIHLQVMFVAYEHFMQTWPLLQRREMETMEVPGRGLWWPEFAKWKLTNKNSQQTENMIIPLISNNALLLRPTMFGQKKSSNYNLL